MSSLKRTFDIALAIAIAILLLPVFACICIALKVFSPGQLLFRQSRIGKNGKSFFINKFRKFPANWGDQGPAVTLHQDSRMTRIGRFLERSKLDELPQLWNVLIGEMSFVGPRPESLRFRHLFVGEFEKVLRYTPGIFGPNQITYRNESLMYPPEEDPEAFYERALFPEKAKNDIAYFSDSSIFSDLRCIAGGVFCTVGSFFVWRKSMRVSLILLAWDICSVAVAWIATHWLKYFFVSQSEIKPAVIELFYTGLVVVPLLLVLVFGLARVYRHPVRYFSETDFFRLIGACCTVWILSAAAYGMMFTSTSSLMHAVACMLSAALMVAPRVGYSRLFAVLPWAKSGTARSRKINVVICGIDQQAVELSSLLKFGFSKANLVGFVVESKEQVGREINGAEVLGEVSELDILLRRFELDQIWISTAVNPIAKKHVKIWCELNGVQSIVLTELPGFQALSDPPPVSRPPRNTVAVSQRGGHPAKQKEESLKITA